MKMTMGLTRQQLTMVVVILMGALLAVLNQTLLTPALPAIMKDLNVSATTVQWLTSGYSLVEAVIIPLNAFLLGRFPTRRLFIGGMTLFMLGSALCALAPGFPWLFAGRICQAAATGVLMPMVFTLILLIFPRENRGSAMGIIGLIISFAPAVGPSISGILVDSIGWRALFVVVVVLALVVVITSATTLKNFEGFDKARFDILSVILLALGMVSLLYSLSTFTSTDNPLISISLMVVGALILGLFSFRQTRLEEPLLRIQVLIHRQFRIATICITILEAILIGSSVLLPMFIQNALGLSATVSGLLMLPGAVLGAIGGLLAGRYFDKHGVRGITILGACVLTVGVAGYFSFGAHASVFMVGVVYGIACIGTQALITPVNTWGINSLPNNEVPHGNAIVSTMEQVGASFGTAFVISLTALSYLVDPAAQGADQMYVGCHIGFAGILGLALLILLLILIFMKDKKTARKTTHLSTTDENTRDLEDARSETEHATTWTTAGIPGKDRPWLVGDVMNRTASTLAESATVYDAITTLQRNDTSGLPIVNKKGAVIGFISDGDIIKSLASHTTAKTDGEIYTILSKSESIQERLASVKDKSALSLATRNVIVVDVNESAEDAFRVLSEKRIKKVPVVHDGHLVGTLSRGNILRALSIMEGDITDRH